MKKWLIASAALLAHMAGVAQYHAYNVPSGSDCILQDYRSPNIPPGIYDAIHEENVSSSDGGTGYFYGGMTHQNGANGTLVQYVCWPASGGFAPYSQQIPVFAGSNMVGYAQIGEGSSCAIKGFWPQFTTNLWTRFAVRYWTPADGTAHLGYQGIWMREPASGNWYHLGTFLYPFAVTGVNGMSGWQENFSGYKGIYIVDHGPGYYHKNGLWQQANRVSFTSSGYCTLINSNAAVESQVGNTALGNNVPITLTMTGQPPAPAFDPMVVSSATATQYGAQLLVQWQLPESSSPQLGYTIEVFGDAGYSGTPALRVFDYDPERRQRLLSLTNLPTPYVRLTLSDIFFNTNTPILITPTVASLAPATNVTGVVPGLTYQYFQSSSGNWTRLPDFSSLTPVRQGMVGVPEPSPRLRRVNYGFTYIGFFTAPTNGLYAFTLRSGDGSRLTVDGSVVVDFDGLHDSSQYRSGGIPLAAGQHAFKLEFFKGAANPVNTTAYTDGLGLALEGPGIAPTDVPASFFCRLAGGSEPAISLVSPTNNATLVNASPGLSATVTSNGANVNSVQFWLTDYYSYYARPSRGVDYFIGQDTIAPFTLDSMIWSAPTNLVRARLVYNGSNTVDSAAVNVVITNASMAPWYWLPLEMHNYPSGAGMQGNSCTLLGDGMNLLCRRVTGDCTLVAHLTGITPNSAGPEGISPDNSWRAGIILRGTTNATLGQPLGDGSGTRFTSLFSSVGGGTYFEDDTMRGGNGDANEWSGNVGGGNRWYKLQRVGNMFLSSVSMDGVNWTQVNSNTLANFGSSIYAGVFIHAVQSMNPNIHHASFDGFSLVGDNVAGPASIAISPQTNTVVGGLPATFSVSVIGPAPSSYQWQLNGTNIPNATNATYSISSAATSDVGTYTVIANSITSAPAVLTISAPAGSAVWTNDAGGSWLVPNNWQEGLVASGVDAVADFSTLSLDASPMVSLNGARTNGTLLFDDLNPSVKHNWTLSTGSAGPLTLAVSRGTPSIAVKSGTAIVSAVVAGTQGFSKTGRGQLTMSGASTVTGGISVNAGALEVQSKSGDTPYAIASGATLRIGYSTGGGYADTGLTINGDGADATTGFYLAGGKSYNCSGQLVLQSAPTTIRRYGTGYANIGTFDINGNGLWCSAAASGSATDPNVQMVSQGYGMSAQIDPGANTTTGDFTINGPLNVGSLGFFKRGAGSLLLKGSAASGNLALNVQAGTVICGAANCLGVNAAVPVSSGATLSLNGLNQAVASLKVASGGTVSFGATNTLTVGTSPSLAGNLRLCLNKGATLAASRLIVSSGTLTNGGTLTVENLGAGALSVGDTFALFSAPSYAGSFASVNLPALPVGLVWITNNLAANGTLTIAAAGSNVWTGAGGDGNWSTAANWGGTLPTNWSLLTFQGTLRQSNTNNLLNSAGQVVFNNGGFAVAGNSLALLWGLLNQTGNNTWALGTVLAAPQSLVSSNGTLTVSGGVANNGFPLTLEGSGNLLVSGVISGTGALIKSGTGTTTLSVQNTYTGGTTINGGLVSLTGGGGSGGTIRGAATINAGGMLQLRTGDAIGYGGSASALTVINIVGGTLDVNSTANQTLGNATINMTGGSITGVSGANLDFFGGSSSLNTFASSTTATIGGLALSPLRQGSTTFTVAAGTAPSGIDLDISSVLRSSPSGDASGAVFIKAGPGTLRLSGANVFARPTLVSAGTLLVAGSLASGSALTVSPGATLGGTGSVKGAATVQFGGSLTPGQNGIGTLTFGNGLSLGGNTVMEISKNSGWLTNDLLVVSGTLALGGLLTVTNLGTNTLAAGDSVKLFNASAYSGMFTNFVLPALPSGLNWSTNTLASDGTLTVTWNRYTLVYTAGSNGMVTGSRTQTVNYAGSGQSVTAMPYTDYFFSGWSDGDLSNPRTDSNVTNNLYVVARFAPLSLVRPVILPGASAREDGAFMFQFTGATGYHYLVEFAPALPPPSSWQVLTDINPLPVSPFSISYPVTNRLGVYRVGFVP